MQDLRPEFFRRLDERNDALFYDAPRYESHFDAAGRAFVADANATLLRPGDRLLDLMAGVATHLNRDDARVTGLGLNAEELAENPHVHEAVVHDLNEHPTLPFRDGAFDAVTCTAAVHYMTRPLATFEEVARLVRPGGRFAVAYTERFYDAKAVLAWRASDDAAHERLVRAFFAASGAFAPPEVRRFESPDGARVTWMAALRLDPCHPV